MSIFMPVSLFCGIDPGLNGGITIMDETGIVASVPMPVESIGTKRRINAASVIDFLKEAGTIDRCAIEQVGAMPGQGVTSMFSFGYGAGMLEAILVALDIPYSLVQPQRWMKSVLQGLPKSEGKSSIIWCKRMFPHFDWRATERSKKPHDGMTDSACLAYYAMKHL